MLGSLACLHRFLELFWKWLPAKDPFSELIVIKNVVRMFISFLSVRTTLFHQINRERFEILKSSAFISPYMQLIGTIR